MKTGKLKILANVLIVICVVFGLALGIYLFQNPVITPGDFQSTSFKITFICWLFWLLLVGLTIVVNVIVRKADKEK